MIPTVTIISSQDQYDHIVATHNSNKKGGGKKTRPQLLIIPEEIAIGQGNVADRLHVGTAGQAIPGTYVWLP
jgi:hypothetical protein